MTDNTQRAAPSRLLRAGRRPLPHRVLAALTAGGLVFALAACGSQHGPDGATTSAADTYGALPTYLPTSGIVADSVLAGSSARPALTTEGDSVEVRLAGGSVRATVTGPVVPGEGLPAQTESTTCTWTVTLERATSTVPVRLADFTTLDHLGGVYPMHLAPGSDRPPARLRPGATATFEVRAVMPTGEGLMRWAADAHHVVASWDFEVEND